MPPLGPVDNFILFSKNPGKDDCPVGEAETRADRARGTCEVPARVRVPRKCSLREALYARSLQVPSEEITRLKTSSLTGHPG